MQGFAGPAAQYRRLRRRLEAEFPGAKVVDGWDGNVTEPPSIGVVWPDGKKHAIRARRPMALVDWPVFIESVVAGFKLWRKENQ